MSIRYFTGMAIFAGAFAPAVVGFPGAGIAAAFTCALLAAGSYLLLE